VSSAVPAASSGSIYVLAGCNGAGKSSIGGQALRLAGIEFFNPDEAARRIASANRHLRPPLGQSEINAAAWHEGRRLLERAIHERANFAFETTLGGRTMTELLERAAQNGLEVHVWFAGLRDVDLHIDRVRRRVAKGGHDIPSAKIRQRFDDGRRHLIRLLPRLAELYLYDNSAEADPDAGLEPAPQLLMHLLEGRIRHPQEIETLLQATPQWAKPLVASALKLHLAGGRIERSS
jgi:predicted ABC-type ATPase